MTLPQGWAETTLGDLQRRTSSLDPRLTPGETFELYSVPSYSKLSPERVAGADIGSTKQIVEPQDVLLCKIVPHIRRSWVVPEPSGTPQIGSGEWIVYRHPALEPPYLRRFLLSDGFHVQFMRTVSGVGGSLMRARPADAGKILVPVPPVAEQGRIVAKLETLMARLARARAELNRAISLANRMRAATLVTAFLDQGAPEVPDHVAQAAGIDARILPLQQTRANWTWMSIGSVAAVTGGLTKNSSRNSALTEVDYLRVANVYSNELRLDDVQRIGCKPGDAARTRLQSGDVLVVEGNGSLQQVGRAAMWRDELPNCSHQNHLIRVRPSELVDSLFVLFWLMSPVARRSIERLAASSSGLHTLSISKVAGIPIPVPNLAEQRLIVQAVESAFARADRLEAEAKKALALIDRMEAAILTRAFRGELVPQDPNDEPASVLLERIRAAEPTPGRGRKPRSAG